MKGHEYKNLILVCTILGLLVLTAGLAYHLRQNQEIAKHYFSQDEKVGYSADGRKWVIEKRFNDYDLVWQIEPDGNLFYAPPKSPQRFMTRFRSFRIDGMSMSIADDSQIMTMVDSVVINFPNSK